MNRRIYKYPLEVDDIQPVEMPVGAEILCVQAQHGRPCIWALVDADMHTETRRFRIIGTGHPVDRERMGIVAADNYVDTFQIHGGSLVFHVFEVTNG